MEGPGWGSLTCCCLQVKDCIEHAVLPMDGATLAEVMRQRGINMRYLGKVLDLVVRSPAREQLDHIYVRDARAAGLCHGGRGHASGLGGGLGLTQTPFSEPLQKIGIGELITRSAKHIFKTYLQVMPVPLPPPWRGRVVGGPI